ncbi:YhjD/YihY/BrkB family envelope integrity protein [Salinifilum ghardaiensis]
MATKDGQQDEPGRLAVWRARYPWLDRLVNAWNRYQEQYGDYYAAALTYFSVLALVPLLMIVFAAAGFALRGDPELLRQLQEGIATAVPDPAIRTMLERVVDEAVRSAGAVGLIGLLAALYSGLGWMTNLRAALTAQWTQTPTPLPFLTRIGADLLALVGLGLALGISFGISALGGLSGELFALLGIGGTAAASIGAWVLALLVSLAASWLVFLWVLTRLPRKPVTLRSAVWGALFAAIGFEILKQVGVFYLGRITSSPSGAAFGPILGLLVFANLTSRFVLFVTAWTASARENLALLPPEPPGPTVIRPVVSARSGARWTAGAFGLGVLAGWVVRRRRR